MTVGQAMALTGGGFSAGEDFVFGIDLSEGQTAEYSDFTAVREKVYGISADLSRKTKIITFVDGWSSRAVSDFLKVRIKFAACSENAVQKAVVKAAENGSKLRCVYAGHGQEPMICGMSVTDISVSDGELFGHVIEVTLSM